MKSDVKIKFFYGTTVEKHKAIEEFKKTVRVIKVIPGATTIVKYSLGQATFDDVEVVKDGEYPW